LTLDIGGNVFQGWHARGIIVVTIIRIVLLAEFVGYCPGNHADQVIRLSVSATSDSSRTTLLG
jgi:hypothetical protein